MINSTSTNYDVTSTHGGEKSGELFQCTVFVFTAEDLTFML